MADIQSTIQEAYSLIRSGKKHAAVDLLLPILRDDKDNLNAWWVLANALDDREEIRQALEQVIRLDPDHIPANNRLAKMDEEDGFNGYDEFALDDDRLDPYTKPKRVVLNKSQSNSNVGKILAIIGIIFVVLCGACFIFLAAGTLVFGGIASEAMNDPNFRQAFEEISQFGELMSLPPNTSEKGSLERGQIRRENRLESGDRQTWTFEVTDNTPYEINVIPETAGLNVQVFVYRPDGSLTSYSATTEDMNEGNPSISTSFMDEGTHTILVMQFFSSSDGTYTIRLD